MAIEPGQPECYAPTVATRRFEASRRWRWIKTCTNYNILAIATVQVILAIVKVARHSSWGIYWAFIGPVVSSVTLVHIFNPVELLTQGCFVATPPPAK